MTGYELFQTNHGNMTDFLFHAKLAQFVDELRVEPLVTFEEIYLVFVFIFMIIAVVLSKNKPYVFSFTVITFYFAILTGSVAYSRYRIPALPFMLLTASYGFILFKKYIEDIKYKTKNLELGLMQVDAVRGGKANEREGVLLYDDESVCLSNKEMRHMRKS